MLSVFLLLEFFAWKQRVQRETFTDWVSTQTNPTKDGKRIYYRCNRSGCPRVNNQELNESSDTKECDEEKTTGSQTVEPKQNHANHHGTEDVEANESSELKAVESQEKDKSAKKKRKRDSKDVVSVKTYLVCSAFLTAKVSNGRYLAKFCTKHSSHDIETEFLRISNASKNEIASKLKTGVSIGSILKTIRKDTDSSYSQLKLITRKDIENLIAKECINQEYKLDSQDAHSVHKFV